MNENNTHARKAVKSHIECTVLVDYHIHYSNPFKRPPPGFKDLSIINVDNTYKISYNEMMELFPNLEAYLCLHNEPGKEPLGWIGEWFGRTKKGIDYGKGYLGWLRISCPKDFLDLLPSECRRYSREIETEEVYVSFNFNDNSYVPEALPFVKSLVQDYELYCEDSLEDFFPGL